MDNLFLSRILTGAVNAMVSPESRIFNRLFAPVQALQMSDRLAFDIISGSERILKNISVASPATVTSKTGRKTITLMAPRLATKRSITAAELNAARAYGAQFQAELVKNIIAREQMDMVNEHARTLEHWASGAIKGKVYDSDGTTVLVDYGLAGTHDITLTGGDLWTAALSDPVTRIRIWKKLIMADAGTSITGWLAYLGSEVMDALLDNDKVRELMQYDRGSQMAENGRIERLAGVELDEYLGSYINDSGVRTQYIDDDEIVLIGLCQQLVDCPYAPVMDLEAGQGVGNVDASGRPVPYYSTSWVEKDPSVRWLKVETRPLPVLQRPGAVIVAKAV